MRCSRAVGDSACSRSKCFAEYRIDNHSHRAEKVKKFVITEGQSRSPKTVVVVPADLFRQPFAGFFFLKAPSHSEYAVERQALNFANKMGGERLF